MVAGWIRPVVGAHFLRFGDEAVADVEREQIEAPTGRLVADARQEGSFENTQPIGANPRRLGGWIRPTFFEEFYNRVYVLPNVIDFGAVTGDSKRPFYVWNAWLKPVTLGERTGEAVVNTSLTGPLDGTTFKALASFEYEADVDEDGAATFRAIYAFPFDTGERPRLILLGERARITIFQPNWKDGYRVEYEYRTEILRSRSGREQRRAIRRTPRKTISFTTVTKNGRETRALQRHMDKALNRMVLFPDETQFAMLVDSSSAGNSALAVESLPSWAVAGTPVYLRASDGGAVTSTILAVYDDPTSLINLEGPHGLNMKAGDMVMLAHRGRLASAIGGTIETRDVMRVDLTFEVEPGSEGVPIARPYAILRGRTLWPYRPNYLEPPKVEFSWEAEKLDYGFGRVNTTYPIRFPTRSYDHLYSGRSNEKLGEAMNIFFGAVGALQEFYLPSWQNDLPMDYPAIAGTRTLEFEGRELYDFYADPGKSHDATHRAIFMAMPSGLIHCNRLVDGEQAWGLNDGRTILTFEEDWPFDIEPDDPLMVGWLYASRLASDKLAVDYLTRTAGKVKLGFVTLEDLPRAV